MKKFFLLPVVVGLCVGCSSSSSPVWTSSANPFNENYADVLWFSGCLFIDQYDQNGNELYRINLNSQQIERFDEYGLEVQHMLFLDSVNFFQPVYHQFTIHAATLPQQQFDSIENLVADEAYEIFQYYIRNINQGRPYILAGMSQGAMMVRDILQRMSDKEFQNMQAAYWIGFGMSAEDLSCRHIRPAAGAYDRQVSISYNSVLNEQGIWDRVYNHSVTCINPVNWSVDCVPASFIYEGDTITVCRDTNSVLRVDGLHDFPRMPLSEPWVNDNLHLLDISLYAPFLKRNILDRLYAHDRQ